MSKNTIYLKDKLFNIYHDLTAFDYEFTSEVGEFNNRFEIVFIDGNKPIKGEYLEGNDLTIIEFSDGSVEFTVNNELQIKSVDIIDLLGRTLYQFKGSSNSEIYSLHNLNRSVYIAKVALEDGQIIIKRAIKRN